MYQIITTETIKSIESELDHTLMRHWARIKAQTTLADEGILVNEYDEDAQLEVLRRAEALQHELRIYDTNGSSYWHALDFDSFESWRKLTAFDYEFQDALDSYVDLWKEKARERQLMEKEMSIYYND